MNKETTLKNIDEQIIIAIQAMSGWELIAVILALIYLVLAIKERIECWYAAFASTAIYTFLFWDVNLLMESALQVYYLLMAVYGWWQWHQHSNTQEDIHIHCWSPQRH
jgi:nicotinamide mononucleotide transporter